MGRTLASTVVTVGVSFYDVSARPKPRNIRISLQNRRCLAFIAICTTPLALFSLFAHLAVKHHVRVWRETEAYKRFCAEWRRSEYTTTSNTLGLARSEKQGPSIHRVVSGSGVTGWDMVPGVQLEAASAGRDMI